MKSPIWSGSSRNSGIMCPTLIPSPKASSKLSTGYRKCNVRKGGASGNELCVTLSTEWQRAQFARAKALPR